MQDTSLPDSRRNYSWKYSRSSWTIMFSVSLTYSGSNCQEPPWVLLQLVHMPRSPTDILKTPTFYLIFEKISCTTNGTSTIFSVSGYHLWATKQPNKLAEIHHRVKQLGQIELENWTPSSHTVFLDLNIRIQNNKIITSTYQKKMNLYLYIPHLSAHPPSCFKGLIAGKYWLKNNSEDYKNILVKFIERLWARGHTIATLAPIFTQVALLLDSYTLSSVTRESSKKENTLYIHWTYHPKGIQSYEVRQFYDQILNIKNITWILLHDNHTLTTKKSERCAHTKSATNSDWFEHPKIVNELRENLWGNPTTKKVWSHAVPLQTLAPL